MSHVQAAHPVWDIRNEETGKLRARRTRLWRRLREVYADSRIRSFQFDDKVLIISCRKLPAKILQPLIVGGYMAFWVDTTEEFSTSRSDQGHLFWPEPRVREDISRLCRIGQTPPDQVLVYLASNRFTSCVAISFIANTLVVEQGKINDRQYRRNLKICPQGFANLPFRIRYHNGPLPNTPEQPPKKSSAIPSDEGGTASLYLEMTNHKKYLCPWDETSHQLASKDKISTASLDDMGKITSERWGRGRTMNQDITTQDELQLGCKAEAIKPVMIYSRHMVLGDHFTMRSPAGESKKAVLCGRRLRFGPARKDRGRRAVKTRHDIYLSNSLIKRPHDPLVRPVEGSVVFTRAFTPARLPGPSARLGQVSGIIEYLDVAERNSGLCFLNQLLYANPCDNLIDFGCYMTVKEPAVQASGSRSSSNEERREEQLPFHSSRFL